ncbi:MAG TPA: EAL domain-containing protein [Syntrophorhabdus sp.]|jgi:EAL and modified HD-GYP domain-containing signal transduction protein|nr:EAL domain-containing protein [Syntrophorhabdus sp.]MDI9558524.1 EAL domain-containing protein [Pseudomonadota bacterium]OPX94437.1 MAG: EAL domain protein [Syntrophorhabdus sp. PtaB.Bin027]OQB77992.1 MAG: EAL domain protein [Deltaproteobacteria bacterium ADurb.Bin135]HNQ45455.1 EAL domain-containing protein [Syntrophorhabdus sp.]
MELNKVFVGRQPILNRGKKIFGYELLFRNSVVSDADVLNNIKATATVIVNTLNNIGLKRLIGEKKGFINVDAEILESGILDLLPKENLVLEILETVELTNNIVELCKKLRINGYQLALDDFIYCEPLSPAMRTANYIKIDLPMYNRQSLTRVVGQLKSYPVKLLAEKVETKEDFDLCYALGFDFFQGYFFAKPSVVTAKSLSPAQLVLIELSRALSREDEFYTIEALFKKNPELNYKLLKFMNSAAFYATEKITSVRQSLALLGYRNLQKWVTLLLFAGEGGDSRLSPLLERAALRGRIMELLAKKITNDPVIADSAFMTGALSMIDSLLEMSITNILSEFNLSQDINNALINREGFLGKLIIIIELLEQERFNLIHEMLSEYAVTLEDLFSMEINAIVEFEATGTNVM